MCLSKMKFLFTASLPNDSFYTLVKTSSPTKMLEPRNLGRIFDHSLTLPISQSVGSTSKYILKPSTLLLLCCHHPHSSPCHFLPNSCSQWSPNGPTTSLLNQFSLHSTRKGLPPDVSTLMFKFYQEFLHRRKRKALDMDYKTMQGSSTLPSCSHLVPCFLSSPCASTISSLAVVPSYGRLQRGQLPAHSASDLNLLHWSLPELP